MIWPMGPRPPVWHTTDRSQVGLSFAELQGVGVNWYLSLSNLFSLLTKLVWQPCPSKQPLSLKAPMPSHYPPACASLGIFNMQGHDLRENNTNQSRRLQWEAAQKLGCSSGQLGHGRTVPSLPLCW